MRKTNHICVCICTFKRTEYVCNLLKALEKQETAGLFNYSVVIVDNDKFESAKQTVETFSRRSAISMSYFVEPEQNIALARNKAIEKAKGNYIGFIDDDEIPVRCWLLKLYKAINDYKADGILGPVLPCFEKGPPRWVLKGRFFERPKHPSGHILEFESTRTGNALLKREIFNESRKWFDPIFGSGGEDRDFFRRKIREGRKFVWCNEARVFERISANRWRRTVLLKRALLRGKMAMNRSAAKRVSVLHSAVAIALYGSSLPVLLVLGHHIFMGYLIKGCDHLGKVTTFLGIDLVKQKYVTGQ